MFQRIIKKSIQEKLFKNKVVILYGPRQVGKTTLVKEILQKYQNTWYINCDDPQTRLLLTNPSLQNLKDLLKGYKLVVIDEAQRIENIGVTLKLIVDNMPDIQVIATGSSSFSLSNTINEPLTGRKYVFHLYPFVWGEIKKHFDPIELKSILEKVLIYGSYPEVFLSRGSEQLKLIVDSYLYQDILEHQRIRKSDILMRLLQAIALQLGSEVSYHELSQIIGIDTATVQRYIDLLEQCFVIFRLGSFARNIRNELKKSKKIYFRDLGVRNTIINNMNPLDLRNDVGVLWENFCISERLKYLSYHNITKNTYFRRTKQQQEIDYIEEESMKLDAFEFKRSPNKKSSIPSNFASNYDHTYQIINPQNFEQFIS